MEVWKDVPGYEGRYQVSDQGRVHGPSVRILKPQQINSGYQVVHLKKTPKLRQAVLVHRVVALTFLDHTAEDVEVNHKNGDKSDNRAENLEWVTRAQNVQHALATGLARKITHSKAVIGTPVDGGQAVHFESQVEAERHFSGKNSSAVHHCIVGNKKSAYGHYWSRA